MKRIVIAGGGTGGHVYPGLAVAEAIRERFPEAVIRFCGGDRIEARLVPSMGWPFDQLPVKSLPRKIDVEALTAISTNAWGTIEATRLLRRLFPEVVLATGGYVCGPVGMAARILRIPLVIQEQNIVPGVTNKVLSRWATAISIPHERANGLPPERSVVTGVPIRSSVLQGDRARGQATFGLEADRPTVLVLGGSQGAQSLNRAVVDSLLLLMAESWQILHQTGPDHLDSVQRDVKRGEYDGTVVIRHKPVGYIERLADAYAAADVIVCRAGASTLAEVVAWGLPSILVPYPHATGGHQLENARVLEEARAAEVVLDEDVSGEKIAEKLMKIFRDLDRWRNMSAAAQRLARPDAADRVVDLLVRAVEGRPIEGTTQAGPQADVWGPPQT